MAQKSSFVTRKLFRWIGIALVLLGAGIFAFVLWAPEGVRFRNLPEAEDRLEDLWRQATRAFRRRKAPDYARLDERLAEKGLALGAPVFLRIFKAESELELWLRKGDRFVLFATYPICAWSGLLGPKLKQGDRQAPEGFYFVTPGRLNPNSRFHLSFDLGYPNAYDRAHGRTGKYLMVHGACVSAGCYAMTDPGIEEIWKFVTTAFRKGQKRIAVHAFPFRLTARNLARHGASPWAAFWQDLKVGYDLFEATRLPPRVYVCRKRYRLLPGRVRDITAPPLKRGCPPPPRVS